MRGRREGVEGRRGEGRILKGPIRPEPPELDKRENLDIINNTTIPSYQYTTFRLGCILTRRKGLLSVKNEEASRPLYVQVQANLAKFITSGEWAPGMKIPSERDLSRILGVSRVTVRQAIAVLVEDGLLYRVHGKGTFVAKPKIEVDARDLISFTSSMLRRGIQPSARVLEFSRIPASRGVAEALNVEVGHQVYLVRRLRLANNLPLVIERSYFPADLCAGMEKADLATVSIRRLLCDQMGISLKRVHQSLEAVVATEEEARLLAVPPGFPLMLIIRLGYDAKGQVVEYSKDLYRGDCSRFISELEL